MLAKLEQNPGINLQTMAEDSQSFIYLNHKCQIEEPGEIKT